jgi:hypothetical protein
MPIERQRPHLLAHRQAWVAVCVLGLLASACSISNDVGNASNGPLGVLKVSDVVVETNLQTVASAGDGIGNGGIATTSGPSTGYHEISVSSLAGYPMVLAGFNGLSDDCLGEVVITSPGVQVLGETQPGTYDFWLTGLTGTKSATCDAGSFAATTTVPSGWPAGDPSSSGWPIT